MISQRGTFTLQGTNIRMPNRYKIRSVKANKHQQQTPIINAHSINQMNTIALKNGQKNNNLRIFNANEHQTNTSTVDKHKFLGQQRDLQKCERQTQYRRNHNNSASHQNVTTHSYTTSSHLCQQIQIGIRQKIGKNRGNFTNSDARDQRHQSSDKTFFALVQSRKLQKTQYIPHSKHRNLQKRILQSINESENDMLKIQTQCPGLNSNSSTNLSLSSKNQNQHRITQLLSHKQFTKQEQQILLKTKNRQELGTYKYRSEIQIDSQRDSYISMNVSQSNKMQIQIKQAQQFKILSQNHIRFKQQQQDSQQDQQKRSQTVNEERCNSIKKAKIIMSKKSFAIGSDGRNMINLVKPKRCACGDCEQCIKDFTYFLRLFSDDNSVPQISAKSWCIWKKKPNANQNKFSYYYGKRIHKVRQVASLSKMVTCMVMMDYLNKYSLDPKRITYEIKKNSIVIGGTSANLQLGQVWTLYDLLFGMMLPSGNDAAIAISECIGLMIHLKNKNKDFDPYLQEWYLPYKNKNYSYLFIMTMNEKCQKSGTLDTHMYNSHGNDAFDQLKNVSTCNQIAKISSEFMSYPLLKEVVNTKKFKNWENTNKLLSDGFEGIKTGITETAGPCLAACYKDIIIIVLNSKSMNQRWIQVKKLVKWIINKTKLGQ